MKFTSKHYLVVLFFFTTTIISANSRELKTTLLVGHLIADTTKEKNKTEGEDQDSLDDGFKAYFESHYYDLYQYCNWVEDSSSNQLTDLKNNYSSKKTELNNILNSFRRNVKKDSLHIDSTEPFVIKIESKLKEYIVSITDLEKKFNQDSVSNNNLLKTIITERKEAIKIKLTDTSKTALSDSNNKKLIKTDSLKTFSNRVDTLQLTKKIDSLTNHLNTIKNSYNIKQKQSDSSFRKLMALEKDTSHVAIFNYAVDVSHSIEEYNKTKLYLEQKQSSQKISQESIKNNQVKFDSVIKRINTLIDNKKQKCDCKTYNLKVDGKQDIYTICVVDPSLNVRIHNIKGQTLKSKWDQLKNEKKYAPKLVMNAGMFDPDYSATGLCITGGESGFKKELNEKKATSGNFFMQPNGLFVITKDGKPMVMPTDTFKKKYYEAGKMTNVKYATQSGPILLEPKGINGKFNRNSTNLNIRNGVGVTKGGKIILIKSENPVSFYSIARLFQLLQCGNALYLDGFVSRIFYGKESKVNSPDNSMQLGPVISVGVNTDK